MAEKSALALEALAFVAGWAQPTHGHWGRGARLCWTHVFPIQSWRQPSSWELAWQSCIEVQSTVSKQSEKERECCSGNSSGMGRDLAALLQLENLTGAASERRLGLLTLGGPSGCLLPATPRTPGLWDSAAALWGRGEVGDCSVLAFPRFLFTFYLLFVCKYSEFLWVVVGGVYVWEQVRTSSLKRPAWGCNLFFSPWPLQNVVFGRAETLWKAGIGLATPLWKRKVCELLCCHPVPTFCNFSTRKDSSLTGKIILDETVCVPRFMRVWRGAFIAENGFHFRGNRDLKFLFWITLSGYRNRNCAYEILASFIIMRGFDCH